MSAIFSGVRTIFTRLARDVFPFALDGCELARMENVLARMPDELTSMPDELARITNVLALDLALLARDIFSSERVPGPRAPDS